MPWIDLKPQSPYTGSPLTFTLTPDAFGPFPPSLVLQSAEGRFELPLQEGVAHVTLVTPGRYTVSAREQVLEFTVSPQGTIPIQTELLLTLGVVLLALGGLIQWTRKRRVGSISHFGQC